MYEFKTETRHTFFFTEYASNSLKPNMTFSHI